MAAKDASPTSGVEGSDEDESGGRSSQDSRCSGEGMAYNAAAATEATGSMLDDAQLREDTDLPTAGCLTGEA